MQIAFDNSYARLPERFYTKQSPVPVKAPELLAFNAALAAQLGITVPDPDALAEIGAGNRLPDGAEPLAQVYAGHQFGGFSPQLGDGRAMLLGEVVSDSGRFDIQLKGSGRTPYSRQGDGRAWLGPVLREYVVSEAMAALGVRTSRALAAVRTGEFVFREQGALPGAVLTRVAASHIRVGTFQFFAARRDIEALQALYEYVVARHYPQARDPAALLEAVIAAQADLVSHWMAVGFIHGVMNTDNTTLSGETIDYGPCAFMDRYHPDMVYSSIDAQGRYSYANQPRILVWNMAQLATALVPLMPDQDEAVTEFTRIVHAMPEQIEQRWRQRFGEKIGLASATADDDTLIGDLLSLMASGRADFTNTFRALTDALHGSDVAPRDQFLDPAQFDAWHERWQARLVQEDAPQMRMARVNPVFIPRNHRIEQMIAAAVSDDFSVFERLLDVLGDPYSPREDAQDLTRPPTESEIVRQTFCGT
ncbi:MAG: YdiU family protein [Pseudomonadota bacterium]